jgi:hypothetical protein
MTRILWTQKQDVGPGPRNSHAMAYDSIRGVTVLFGGADPDGNLFGDTWEWDGENWTQMEDVGPSPRLGFAMAFDAERKQTVLFGGGPNQPDPQSQFADTWGWDGQAWTQLADSGPGKRESHALAYDGQRQRTVLFGGVPVADTWEWDGTAWTQKADTGPPARSAHCMAYDTNRSRTVLFGGFGRPNVNVLFGDTWEWDGALWRQVAHFGATPCDGAALAFKGDSIALFGGERLVDPRAIFGTTWTWDGKHWTLRQDIGPAPRAVHAMAFDTKRGRLVLFGGTDRVSQQFQTFGDTWEA